MIYFQSTVTVTSKRWLPVAVQQISPTVTSKRLAFNSCPTDFTNCHIKRTGFQQLSSRFHQLSHQKDWLSTAVQQISPTVNSKGLASSGCPADFTNCHLKKTGFQRLSNTFHQLSHQKNWFSTAVQHLSPTVTSKGLAFNSCPTDFTNCHIKRTGFQQLPNTFHQLSHQKDWLSTANTFHHLSHQKDWLSTAVQQISPTVTSKMTGFQQLSGRFHQLSHQK